MIFSKDLPIDPQYPDSCVYWIYLDGEHTDPRVSGYVGISIRGAENRFKSHMKQVRSGSNLLVHNAIRKYGDRIKVKTLSVTDPEMSLLIEAMLRPVAQQAGTWNINAGGETTCLGRKVGEEELKRMSARASGELNPFYGKTHSEDARLKISQKAMCRKASEESRAKMSATRQGKKLDLSEAQRKKRSDNAKRLMERPDIKEAMAACRKPLSDEAKSKISAANKGRKMPEGFGATRNATMRDEPWNNPKADKARWLEAIKISELLVAGFTELQVKKTYGLSCSDQKFVTMFKRIKSGWNPSYDSKYMSWFAEHNKQKELYETPCAT